MRLRFWGTRGSLPVALTAAAVRQKIIAALVAASGQQFASVEDAGRFADTLPFATRGTFGGHSSCVEIELAPPARDGHDYVLCDMGSGLRPFGSAALARHGAAVPNRYHVFMSHLHWDHIMGFPFFAPAYLPGNTIFIYGCHEDLELAFRRQQDAPSFPVAFNRLGAQIRFVRLEPGRTHDVAGMQVTAKLQRHTGDSYGYRFAHGGRVAVYSTDSEHKLDSTDETRDFVEFFRNADAVVFDAMYSLADAISVKEDWGHSSNMVGVELCQLAEARRLVLFHHEPIFGDERLAGIEAETRRLESITREGRPELAVIAAYDGLELDLR